MGEKKLDLKRISTSQMMVFNNSPDILTCNETDLFHTGDLQGHDGLSSSQEVCHI